MNRREKTRWQRRERKYKKRRYGMRVSGRSVKGVLLPLIGRKSQKPSSGKGKQRKKQK